MKNAVTRHGHLVDATVAGVMKSMQNGCSVSTYLAGEKAPFSLQLTLNWPDALPVRRIDFALVAPNGGHAFMCLFSHGTFGPVLIYSENSHSCLVRDLLKTTKVEITEIAHTQGEQRIYECNLKHCLD